MNLIAQTCNHAFICKIENLPRACWPQISLSILMPDHIMKMETIVNLDPIIST